MWLRKEMAINTTSKASAVLRFRLNRSICDFIIKSELPGAPFWLFYRAFDILVHIACFILKIFNQRGNYPVLTHYAGSENSPSFHFQEKSYSDLQPFPTATSYTNRTVYYQQSGVFSGLIFFTSLHLCLCGVWHQLLLVYISRVGLCEWGERSGGESTSKTPAPYASPVKTKFRCRLSSQFSCAENCLLFYSCAESKNTNSVLRTEGSKCVMAKQLICIKCEPNTDSWWYQVPLF